MKAIIIGAGLGGLTAAALLCRDGHTVTVFDRNEKPGGVMATAEQNGYQWEQGPLILSDLLPGEPLYELLAGFDIHLPTVRADRGSVLPDYEMWRPTDYAGPYWRRERLKQLFPKSAPGIDAYYRFYDDMVAIKFLSGRAEKAPRNPYWKLRLALAFLHVKKYAGLTAKELTDRFFHDERISALYTGILADFCADPAEVQGLGVPFLNLEPAFDARIPLTKNGKKYQGGFCYLEGGCQKLPEALADYIRAHGGNLCLGEVVDKVLLKDGRAAGVRLSDGRAVFSDVVVGSGGGREFFYGLVGREHLDAHYREVLDTYRPMEAVFMVHLGVDFDPLEFMKAPLCYYYRTYDIGAATRRLRAGVYHGGEDGFLIFVPSAHAKDFAPAGKHCVTIYTVAPDTLRDGDWAAQKEAFADHLIALAEAYLPGLSHHITEKKIMTALDYRLLTHMDKSAFGGVVPIWHQENPPHVTPVPGLYFVGQQSENGGGVTAVALGAKRAYEKLKRIERDGGRA